WACSADDVAASAPATSTARSAPVAGQGPRVEAESDIGSPVDPPLRNQVLAKRSHDTISCSAPGLQYCDLRLIRDRWERPALRQVKGRSIPGSAGPLGRPDQREPPRPRQPLEVEAIGRHIAAVGEVENHHIPARARHTEDLRETTLRDLSFRQQ